MNKNNHEYLNLTNANLHNEHLCCIIRSKVTHPGVEKKREWLTQRIKDGHVLRKLSAKGCAFIEYAPLEKAFVPIEGKNYLYLYCEWVNGEFKGHGYGKELMEYCIEDAKNKGKSGICMLGAQKQKAWLSDQSFVKSFGFKVVDSTPSGYELLALSFDGTLPKFTTKAKTEKIDNKELTIYYDFQCPYMYQTIETVKQYCLEHNIPINLIEVKCLKQAKELPCAFNNFAVFYNGEFQTVNLLNSDTLERILKK